MRIEQPPVWTLRNGKQAERERERERELIREDISGRINIMRTRLSLSSGRNWDPADWQAAGWVSLYLLVVVRAELRVSIQFIMFYYWASSGS